MAIMAKQTLAEKMAARKEALASGQPGGSPTPAAGGATGASVTGINAPEGAQAPNVGPPLSQTAAGIEAATLREANADATPAAATAPAAGKRLGRPPGKGKAAAAAAAAKPATVAPIVGHGTAVKGTTSAEVESLAAQVRKEAPVQIVDLKSYALFINCLPVKGGLFIQASEVCSPLCVEVAAAHKVGDYRLIDFVKGPAYLREALNRRLSAEPITGIGIVLDSRTDLGKDTQETFEKHAGLIVRSF